MVRISALLLTFLLVSLGTLARADPPGRVARLNYAAGAVSFAPAQAPDAWTQAVRNRPLTDGDRLWAGDTGRAELHIGSMALRLAPLTSLDVLHLDDDVVQLRLAQGALNVRVRELDADETIEIATPTGAVLLRQPGSYRISSDPHSDVSRVLVHYGQAEVVTPFQTVTVPSSQLAVIPSGGGIGFEVVSQASIDEFDRWSAERDRREDRVGSARYVSRDMTGYEDLDLHGTWRTLPEYGPVWVPARVVSGWAPYRHGHWSWIAPWGWTWIDDAPWGFAPSHYGRWVWVDSYWAWAPGRRERRPVYAPALVAFIGGSNFDAAIGSGPAVGWFPLGWGEAYRPWYRASSGHVQRVNITHVTNLTDRGNVNRYVHRNRREAITVVPQQAFVSARPAAQSIMTVSPAALAHAEILRDRQPAEPARASFAAPRTGQRPPSQTVTREVMTITTPTTPATRDRPRTIEGVASPSAAIQAPPSMREIERERRHTHAVERAAPQGAIQNAAPFERRQQPATEWDTASPRARGAANSPVRTEVAPNASLPSSVATPAAAPAAPAVIPPAPPPPAVVHVPETPAARNRPRTIEREASPSAAIVAPSSVRDNERERKDTRAVERGAPQGAAQNPAPFERRQQPATERDTASPRAQGAANSPVRTEVAPNASLPSSVATPAAAPAAPAVIPPAPRPPAVLHVPEKPATRSALPPAGADLDRRNARREAGPRDEAPRAVSGESRERERIPATVVREAPRQPQAPVAPPQARMEREADREAPRARAAPAVEAPASRAEAAQPPPAASQRREERGREGPASSRPGREGAAARGSRDG